RAGSQLAYVLDIVAVVRRGRSGARLRDVGLRSVALERLDGLLPHHFALELRDVVDEQHAVEMIDLMLNAGREHALGLDLLRPALAVGEGDADFRRTLDLLVIFGDRQAALLVDR